MATHTHREHSGDDLVSEARGVLTEAGEQWTDMRGDVFAALVSADKPISAYDLAEAVSTQRGKRAAPNSVYRILDLFVDTNLAMRVESANAYIANRHPGCEHDCIFLVCDICGQATHVDDGTISASLRGIAQERSFAPRRPVIEIRGECSSCA